MINNLPPNGIVSGVQSFTKCINREIEINANTPSTFLKTNLNRAYAAIVNNSSSQVTLVLGDSSQSKVNQGIVLTSGGGSFEITQINLYCGSLTAISEADCRISFVECVK
jgi:hypothetical protein